MLKIMLKRIASVRSKSINIEVCQLQNNRTSSQNGRIITTFENKLNHIMRMYEEFIGLTDVKSAQAKVIDAEANFKRAQELRIQQQQQMVNIQESLRQIHVELDKTTRGEDRYLQLITKEHKLLKEDKSLMAEFRMTEKQEYDHFTMLSLALRESHEKERAQGEKTKYWSIIGSITGTLIGALVTALSNRYRMKQLRELVAIVSSETVKCNDLFGKIHGSFEKSNSLQNDSDNNKVSIEESLEKLVNRTMYLEKVNTGLISTIFVIVPLMTWLLYK